MWQGLQESAWPEEPPGKKEMFDEEAGGETHRSSTWWEAGGAWWGVQPLYPDSPCSQVPPYVRHSEFRQVLWPAANKGRVWDQLDDQRFGIKEQQPTRDRGEQNRKEVKISPLWQALIMLGQQFKENHLRSTRQIKLQVQTGKQQVWEHGQVCTGFLFFCFLVSVHV